MLVDKAVKCKRRVAPPAAVPRATACVRVQYSFLDPRGVGALEGVRLDSALAALEAGDRLDAAWRPQPGGAGGGGAGGWGWGGGGEGQHGCVA